MSGIELTTLGLQGELQRFLLVKIVGVKRDFLENILNRASAIRGFAER